MNYTRNLSKWNPENFPPAFRLLPLPLREPIQALYAFATCLGAIAGSKQTANERRRELMAIEQALIASDLKALPEQAVPFARFVRAQPPLLSYARDLLSARMQDVLKTRYHDYSELLDYCHRSAVPIGRAFLHLCAEKNADFAAADALATALEILGHVENCSDDYVNLDRVYLPLSWFTEAGVDVKALAASDSKPALRRILNRMLDHCDALLKKSRPLAGTITQKGVRKEAVFLHSYALETCALLRKRDPLAGHARLGRMQMFLIWFDAILA